MAIGDIGLNGTNATELVVKEMKTDIDFVTTRSKGLVGMTVRDLDIMSIIRTEFMSSVK